MSIVGNLVANVTADISGFKAQMAQVPGITKITINEAREATQSGGGIGAGLMTAAVGAAAAIGAGAYFAVNAFRDAEQQSKKLESVLASTGGAAGITSDEIKALAGELQNVTNFEADATVGAAAVLATFTQIKGDIFKEAIVSAQDLSAVMGQDLQTSIIQIGKALNDPIKGVSALQKVGVSFTAEQKEQIKTMQKAGDIAGAQALILKELQTEFGGAAKATAEPLTILWNQLGDIVEGIGSMLLPSLNLIATTITGAILPASGSWAESFARIGQVAAEYVGAAIQFISDSITVAGFVIENFGTIASVAFMEVQLASLQFVGTLEHFFTATLPGYLTWFGENWRDVFTSALNFTSTVFLNMGDNIRNAMGAIWDYIKSGGSESLELTWKPLTDGFVSTVSELPEIADRIPSDLENALSKSIADTRQQLEDDLGQTMLDAAGGAVESTKTEMPKFSPGDFTKESQEGGKPAVVDMKASAAVGAAVAGSSQALSSIFSAMRGDDIQKQILDAQLEANRLAQEQVDATRDLAETEGEVVEI